VNLRTAALVILPAVLVIGIIAGAFWATDTIGQDGGKETGLPDDFAKFPPEKQALELQERADREAAEARPHAPKQAGPSPILSCPGDVASFETAISPFTFGPFPGGKNLVNEAGVASDKGEPYRVFAGALDEDPAQGVIIVLPESLDPCATAAGVLPLKELQTFVLPAKSGAATLTAVEGDLVSFQTPGGTKGQFNFTTGPFTLP
jgi:hypothetical protein